MRLLLQIAIRQLIARKRQSIVSLFGIVLGTAFFLAISSMMKGSENDFIKRLVDNSPHITVSDEFRSPRRQPLEGMYPQGAIVISNTRPTRETRGIRGFEGLIREVRTRIVGATASPVLLGQAVVNYAGRDAPITVNGMIPEEIVSVTTISEYMIDGSVQDLIGYADGIIIGSEMAKTLRLKRSDTISVVSSNGIVRIFKIVGIFRTGRAAYDSAQSFVHLRRAQSLFNKVNRANSIIIKIPDPYLARPLAAELESRFQYKHVSWQESSEDLINTLAIRNRIMYTVVSAVLLVAAFGIYNVISTVVIEKYRDIAILKSIGFYPREIRTIFLAQGIVLGCVGSAIGLPLGMLFMRLLSTIRFKPPGGSQVINMPIDWGWQQFAVAASFALCAAVLAAYLPARKAGSVKPVDILRGGMG